MKYRIRNHTDLDTREVRRLVAFAGADLDFDRGVVWADIRWTKPHHDRINQYPASGHFDAPVTTALRVAKPDAYPLPWSDLSYMGHELGVIETWQEALVAIAAHELKHLSEWQRGCRQRGRPMEARCDAYAFSRLSAYREKVAA